MPIKHAFTSAIADDAVPAGKVQPSNWNANHDLSGLVMADLPVAVARPAFDALPVTGNTGNQWASLFPGLMLDVTARGTLGWVNGTPRAIRIFVPRRTTLTAMAWVTTLGASHKMHAGLFRVDANTGLLGTLVQDFGEIDGSTTGKKVFPNTAAAVEPGTYWLYYNSNGTTAVMAGIYHATATSGTAMTAPIVTETWLGNTAQVSFRIEGTVAYTTAVPATPTMARATAAPTGAIMPIFFQGT